MPEAVIVDAIRTPIGRAAKGSLKDVRADDLAAVPLKALVERNPGVDFAQTNDLMMGCGFQMGEAGYNVGRNAALLAGLDHHIPATTVNRFCASSLQTIRMAFHAIKAGEGARDDGPRPGTTMEKLAELKPAFDPENGTVTAGNACPLNDGAAAVLVMSADKAAELGLTPRARIVASSVAAIRPEIMGLGPIPAVEKVLAQAGMTIGDIDVLELNEAFAAQVVPCRDEWGIDPEKLNPFGGAIALGHPFGMTGARIMTTLLNNLDALDGTIGLETMCVAGGMGQAMIVERLS